MSFCEIADSKQITTLTQLLDAYCQERRILPGDPARLAFGRRIMTLFNNGMHDIDAIRQALADDAGLAPAAPRPNARTRTMDKIDDAIRIDDATWNRARAIFLRKHPTNEAWSDTARGTHQRFRSRDSSEAPVVTVISDEARARYIELARTEMVREAASGDC
jgi:hypothetical protein